MSEETKTPEQQYIYQTDQQVSVNAYFEAEVGGEIVRFQITNRYGATPEKITKTVKAAIDAFALLRTEYPRANTVIPQTENEPTRQPIDDSGHDLPAIYKGRAGRLSVESKDGKYSFKIEDAQFHNGRKGSKFGVRIWDEVLRAAGLNIDPGQPMPQIGGWAFEYIENDKGYPYKVTRLLPPTF